MISAFVIGVNVKIQKKFPRKQELNPRPKSYRRLGVRLSKSLKEDMQ